MTSTPRLVATALLTSTATLAFAGAANATTFGPFANQRWGIGVLATEAPVTVDLSNTRYCREGRLVDGGERFTGFTDAPTAPGTCRTVVAEFTSKKVLGDGYACKNDWRTGKVLSDVTLPVGAPQPSVTLAGGAGSYSRLCIYGLRQDGRWHTIDGTRYIAVGPFKLPKPTLRRAAPGRLSIECAKHTVTGVFSNDSSQVDTTVTIRVGKKKITRAASVFTLNDKAIKGGAKVSVVCSTVTKTSVPGPKKYFPSAKTSKPMFTSAVATKRIPRK